MTKLYRPIIVKKEIDDEHFYYVDGVFTPAVTAILQETLPMPLALKNWIGEIGNEKAQEKLEMAGERGSAIHKACELLCTGKEVSLVDPIEYKPNKSYKFTERDKKTLIGFINWFAEYQPKPLKDLHPELVVASKRGYAGTVDFPCIIGKYPYVIDFKTSKGIYDSFKLQLVGYRNAIWEMFHIRCKMGILHLNPNTKRGYSFYDDDEMEIKDKRVEIRDFLAVLRLCKVLNGGKIQQPPEVDVYPPVIKLERS